MRKCSEALRKRSAKITNDVYNETVSEVFNLDPRDENNINAASYMLRLYNRLGRIDEDIEDVEDFVAKRDRVETLYQEKIKQLSTKQLTDILNAHERPEGILRAAKTIETIVSELARRAIFDDSGESESIDDDGDVHEPKRQSPKRRKKVNSSRRKATKDK